MSTVEPPRQLGAVRVTPYVLDDDPAAAVARLKERFAGVPIWFGNSTRHYWAVLGGRLVEAADSAELDRVLDGAHALQPRRPMHRRRVRHHDVAVAYGVDF